MDLEVKKDLTSNWFKTLQNALCHSINNLENDNIKFSSTHWRRNKKKDEGGGEYRILKNGKILEILENLFSYILNELINLSKICFSKCNIL